MANTVSVLNILVNAQTGAAVGQLTALDGKLKQTAATANKTSTSIGAKLGSAAKLGGAALAVGVVAGLVKSVKAASEFETSFAEVRKTVDASEKGFGRLEKGLRGLAKQIPINVNDLNDLAGQAGALGIASKDIVRFTRTAAELGIATDMSAEEASNALARLSNIMGTSSKDFRRLGSSFVALGNDGASTEREIAAMALRLAATGKQVGLNESQVLSFSSALASVGIEAEAGGSAFSRAFSLMSESVATGNDTLAKFAEVAGMGPRGFAALFERNAARGMVAFIEGLGKIKREGGNALAVLSDMGINEVRLRNALLSAAGAGNLFNKQLRVGSDAWRENNALTKEAQERYGTSASKVKLLGNRANDLAITIGQKLDPAVRGLLDGLLALTSGDVGKWLDRMKRKSQGASDAVDVLRNAWKVLGPVFDAVIQFVLARLKALWDGLRNVVRIVKGMVVAVAGLLSGDWRKAWNGAKAIVTGSVGVVKSVVRGLIAPLKGSFVAISKIMASIFGGAWEKVRDTFRDGANAAIRVVNNVIDVLNRIPGVPDIGRVGLIVNPDNTSRSGRNARRVARQRGGTILGGRPSGDSVPAMLERGEYVLNRNAVQRVGVKRLNELNFKQASRFQDGGPVGMIGGGLLDAAGRGITNLVPGAGLAGKALGKGAGFFIKQLPKPDIPEPFAGVGPWLIKHVTKWIKGKVPELGGKLGNVSGSLGAAMKMAQQMGLTITSTTGGTHAKNSWHYAGRAFDASNGVNTPEMRNYFLAAAGRWGSSMLELFYDPIGWYIKNGAKVPGAIGGHSDHVHTAMQNGGLVGSILRMVTGGAVVKQGAPVLARKGFDHKASAGIFGNAWQESTWNPAAMEGSLDNGGLFGFTAGEKSLANLRAFAGRRGKPWTDVPTQIQFMLASGGQSLRDRLNALDSIPDTTKLFMDEYERPGIPNLPRRIQGGFMASKIMRGMRNLGGGRPVSPEQRRARGRADKIKQLVRAARSARSPLAKKGAWWKVLAAYARWGDFGRGEGARLLSEARDVASIANPNLGVGKLAGLYGWLDGRVDLSGDDENRVMAGKLERVRRQGAKIAGRRKKRVMSRIAGLGEDFEYTPVLTRLDKLIGHNAEVIDLANRQHTSDWSADGSEYSEGEVDYERRLNENLLRLQKGKRANLNLAIPYARHLVDMYSRSIKSARRNPLDRWRIPGFKRGRDAARTTLSRLRGERTTLVGLTGDGGELGDTMFRLRELGAIVSGGSEPFSIQDILRIVESARLGVYEGLPRFHSGGVVPGVPGSEVPIMAQAGETVVRGGVGDVTVNVDFADGMGWLREFMDVRIEKHDRVGGQRARVGVR